jgi:abortive infection bacteriophage resistance protein
VNPPREAPAKPALSLDEQISLLLRRGMRIDDVDRARHHLGHLNYYRLRGYSIWFETAPVNGEQPFRPGTHLDDVIALYEFDRRLRLEINDAIESVEVSLRTRWAYVLGLKAGPAAHRAPALFNDSHVALLNKVDRLFAERQEVFLRRYLDRGEEPPIWALCEALSLGDLSKWLRSLKNHDDRQSIADAYRLREKPFCSFVEHLSYVRNVCAHHARLWNRSLVVATLGLPKKPTELVVQLQRRPERSLQIYNTLVMLAYLLRIIAPDSDWRQRLRKLVEERSDLWDQMGFPAGWQSFDLWEEHDWSVVT